MSEINRKDIISDDALSAPLLLAENLEKVLEKLNQIAASSKTAMAPTVAAGSAASTTKVIAQLSEEQKQLVGIQNQVNRVIAQTNTEYIAQTKVLNQVKQSLKEKTVLGDRDARSLNKQNASLIELQAALAKNRKEYGSLRTEEERASKAGQELLKVVQTQAVAVKELNESQGKYTDNVGDYQNAFKKLNDELKQAKDELAGVGATLGTDSEEFAAATIRAGELQDQINNINESSRAVSASPFENLGNSFDLVTGKLAALDFGGAAESAKQFAQVSKTITLKETIQGIGDFTKSLRVMAKAILTNPLFILTAVFIGIAVAVYALRDKLKPLVIAFEAVGNAIDYVVQLGKDFLDFLGLATFAADEKAKAIIDAANRELEYIERRYSQEIKLAAAANKETIDLEIEKQRAVIAEATKGFNALVLQYQLHNGKLSEEQQKQYDEYIKIIGDANIEIQALLLIQQQKELEAEKKRQDELKALRLKEQGDYFNLLKFRLQVAIETQERIAANEKETDLARFEALRKAEGLRLELAKLEKNQALRQEGLTASGRLLILEQYNEEAASIARQGVEERTGLTDSIVEREKELHLKRLEEAKQEAADLIQIVQNRINTQVDLVKEQAVRGEITTEESVKRITAIQKQGAEDIAAANINALEAILENEDLTADERKEIEQQLFDFRSQLTDALYQQITEADKGYLEKLAEQLEAIESLYGTYASNISGLLNTLSENRIANIENEQEVLSAKQEEELALYEGNAEKQNEINEYYAKKQAALEQEKAKAQRRAAVFDKASSAIQAGIATALAVTKALPNIPLAVAVGAAGAIQVAAILAKQIPQYEKGTKNHPGGFAIVGEKGPELIEEPNKAPYLSPGRATLLDLASGAKVTNTRDTMRNLALQGITRPDSITVRKNDELRAIEKGFRSLERTVKNKKELSINFSRRGVEALIAKGHSKTNSLNEFYK